MARRHYKIEIDIGYDHSIAWQQGCCISCLSDHPHSLSLPTDAEWEKLNILKEATEAMRASHYINWRGEVCNFISHTTTGRFSQKRDDRH